MANSIFMWQESLEKTVPHVTQLCYKITGAKTIVPQLQGLQAAALTAFDAIASQSVIDNFLGTTNEFLVAAFDATAMGTDAFAVIVNMKGQAAQLAGMDVRVLSGTNGATETIASASVGTLTASTLETAYALGAYGNIAVKSVLTGLDALTAGQIIVNLRWVSK